MKLPLLEYPIGITSFYDQDKDRWKWDRVPPPQTQPFCPAKAKKIKIGANETEDPHPYEDWDALNVGYYGKMKVPLLEYPGDNQLLWPGSAAHRFFLHEISISISFPFLHSSQIHVP
jgi:hypothetical protein